MNILKWLKDRGGKMAVSALQAAGIATVVGVAGIGAYSVLSSPAEDPSLSPSSYNPGEVVYVAGNPNSGMYQSGTYGMGQGQSGPNESSVRITTKTLNRLDAAERRAQTQYEMEEYVDSNRFSAPSVGAAAKTGMTEGLGMGANEAKEMGLGGAGNDPMASISGVMSNMQGMLSQAQQQAQGGGEQPAEKKGKASLKPASMASRAGTATTAGGGEFNSSFAIQNSGKNQGRANAAVAESANNALASAQAAMSSVTEGARLTAKPSFGRTESMENSREATVMDVRNTKDGKELRYMMKRSNQVAMNKSRAANDGSDPFLSDTKISGGMHIEAENVTTGQGQNSKDFSADTEASLRGIKSWGLDTQLHEDKVKRARDRLTQMMWTVIPAVLVLAMAIAVACAAARASILGFWFWVIAGVLTVASLVLCGLLIDAAKQYIDIRGTGSSLSTWGIVTGIALIGITGLAWVRGVSKFLEDSKILKILAPAFTVSGGIYATSGILKGTQLHQEGKADVAQLNNELVDGNSQE